MAFQQKEKFGSLFKNKKKTTDSHPDYEGKCLIGGKEYRIAGWLKERENGEKWMSLSFKDEREGQTPPRRQIGAWDE